MSRNYPDFLSAYLQYSEHTEPPLSFHIWTALSIMGTALQRKVYLKWGFNTLYPNMYVVFIGPSACGKGLAMRLGKDLLSGIQTVNLASESITREALIQDIKNSESQFIDPSDDLAKYHSSLGVFSEELSVFLGQCNVKFIADLTDWFDCKDQWTYRTKGQGTDSINCVCLSILGASAPDWLRSILPPEAFGGGFTSRIIFVVEEGKRQRIADPTIDPKILAMRKYLIEDLEQINLLAGRMQFHEKTMELYTKWYLDAEKNVPIKDPTFAGYCERRAVHLLKLSMICSASRSDEKVILPGDFERAMALLGAVEPKMPRAFMGLGKARYGEMTAIIYEYLMKVKHATTSEILDKFHYDLDEYTLSIVMKTLMARKRVNTSYNSETGETSYLFVDRRENGREEEDGDGAGVGISGSVC